MGMGRFDSERQGELWVTPAELPKAPGHVFYRKLNQVLAEAGFDDALEELCRPYYRQGVGRPGIAPGVYFRMLMVGYFEGIASQRGIAWRCADSLSLREFLRLGTTDPAPDHSSLTRIRDRLPIEVHEAAFHLVLAIARDKQLLRGKTVAVDATTLEANAAMRSIVRRDTGEDYKAYLRRLMREEGLIDDDDEPSDDELRRFDKGRKKKMSNEEWTSPSDPDSRIARMKNGATHLAYKAEHVVDLASDLIVAAEIYPADAGDTSTLVDSVIQAQVNLGESGGDEEIEEVAADAGYHAADTLELADALCLRTYIPEPRRQGRRRWRDKPPELQRVVYANRRRTRRAKGRRLQRLRSEMLERTFAHLCGTGGGRRVWVRGIEKVRKRWLLHAAARNLGLILRKLFGVGTPRSAWERLAALLEGAARLGRLTSYPQLRRLVDSVSWFGLRAFLKSAWPAPPATDRPTHFTFAA